MLYSLMRNNGVNIEVARTIAVNAIVAGQAFYLFNCRKLYKTIFTRKFFNNIYAFIAVGLLIVAQLMFTYIPFMNTLFGTSPIIVMHWLYVVLAGLVVFFIVEIEKFLTNKIFSK